MDNLRKSKTQNSLIFLIFLVHIALWLLLYPTVEEDAFIYLRFAQNIADGYGYVFNIGGEHVESGTSPIWLLLLVLGVKLHIPPIFAMKILGLVFSLLAILITGQLASVLTDSLVVKLLAMATLATSYPLVYWADQGLETPLIAFLLSLMALCLIDSRWRQILSLVCIVLVLARPEGVIYLSLVLGWGVWQRYCGDHIALRDALLAIALSLLSVALCTLWRIWYFGDFVAHPFYFKSSQLGASNSLQLLSDIDQHLRLDLLLAPAALAFFLKKLQGHIWLLVFTVILQAVWFVSVSDHFPFERHFVPALPLIYALSATGWWALARNVSSQFQCLIFFIAVSIPIFAVIQNQKSPLVEFSSFFLHQPEVNTKALLQRIVRPDVILDDPLDAFLQSTKDILALGKNWESAPGHFLAAAYPKGITIAYHEMGQTPYYAGQDKVFIDTAGLVTRQVGFYRFSTSFDSRPSANRLWDMRCIALTHLIGNSCPSLEPEDTINYILDQRPDVVMDQIIVATIFGERLPPLMLLKDARFQQLYRLRYTINNFIQVYEKKDRNFPPYQGSAPGAEIKRAF